jgi:hypothetical protein
MDVAAWLRGRGLERCEQAFRDNEFDGKVLPNLTAEDLKASVPPWSGIAGGCSPANVCSGAPPIADIQPYHCMRLCMSAHPAPVKTTD